MALSLSNRVRRGFAAGVVLLVHVALVGMLVLMRAPSVEDPKASEPIFATLIDQPRPAICRWVRYPFR